MTMGAPATWSATKAPLSPMGLGRASLASSCFFILLIALTARNAAQPHAGRFARRPRRCPAAFVWPELYGRN
jgi:hypothetical protein